MSIKKWLLCLGVFGTTAGLWAPAWGADAARGGAKDFGVGFEAGQPMGLTAKYWFNSSYAVDAFAGYHYNKNFDAHADYLLHSVSLHVPQGKLPYYIGIGGRVLLGDDSQFGVRVPLGLAYLLPKDPLELFVELAPVVKVNNLGADLDGAIGVRYFVNYFK